VAAFAAHGGVLDDALYRPRQAQPDPTGLRQEQALLAGVEFDALRQPERRLTVAALELRLADAARLLEEALPGQVEVFEGLLQRLRGRIPEESVAALPGWQPVGQAG
jgi:hypothetical protein